MTYPTRKDAEAAAVAMSASLQATARCIEFNGQDCDTEVTNYCGGWDGVSTRCTCENRRVYWKFIENKDHTWSFYANAY